ncbi:MAG: F0F1 ATP synthase subunit epsilon [Ruminococcus sp.]|nr:F0F1 ATP synthase subunit epsilon [Ruminococcus sp.]
MSKTFQLDIIASDRVFYSGECEELVFPALDGLYGVLPLHEPLVTAVSPGELKYKVDGKWYYAAVSNGFAEIMPQFAVILADYVEFPEEIDIKRAKEAKMRAQERMKQKQSVIEYYRTQAALNRAMNRLKVSGKRFKDM